MRNTNDLIISAADNQTSTSGALSTGQICAASFSAIFGDATAIGTFKIQASNDVAAVPVNWTNIPNKSVSVTSGTSALISIPFSTYRWLRASFTPTGAAIQTIAPIADTGVKKAQTVTTIADLGVKAVNNFTTVADVAGSLNNTYLLLSAMNSGGASQHNYYVWYDNGSGVDPALAGKTAIPVVYTDDDTDETIAGLTITAINLIASSVVLATGATNAVVVSNLFMGNSTPIADGLVPTGFAFSTSVSGVASNLNSKFFTLSSVNVSTKAQKNWYLWLNINGEGVDPGPITGKTAIPITGVASVTANALATSIRSALNALTNDFTAAGANAAVIITDVVFGPVTAAVDGSAATGFTFGTVTTGVASNLNNTLFYLQDANSAHSYYVWNNVDGVGTDPLIAGRTGAPVAFSSGSTAGTIGTALASVIAALNGTASFSATGTTTVTVTNLVAGPFVPITDASPPTHFTFAVTAGGNTTIQVFYDAIGF